jgi:hypothetical protein
MTSRSHVLRAPVALAAAVVLLATTASPPARAARPDARGAHVCVDEQSTAARARAAGDGPGGGDEGAPPAFTPGFFRHTYTLDASMDGADGQEIPVSVEEVCDVPRM